ncbi:hypothetical protein [Halalkalibacter urbisdiaboli]|uniref:hypothetical protein n=1 Tax=Halalkalibacter urbisdiaboli TaxID=1960589 RepID=UPI000B443178|nr:hypothetical protein [Halalkalibacter urbisdiaboli]
MEDNKKVTENVAESKNSVEGAKETEVTFVDPWDVILFGRRRPLEAPTQTKENVDNEEKE